MKEAIIYIGVGHSNASVSMLIKVPIKARGRLDLWAYENAMKIVEEGKVTANERTGKIIKLI